MEQLQEIEQAVFNGDLSLLTVKIEELKQLNDWEALYDTAGMLMEYGFMEQAANIFETLLKLFPTESQLKVDLAQALLEIDQEDHALLLLMEVTREDEVYLQALLTLADYYQMTGLQETALVKLQEALSLAPHEPVIQFAYAELLFQIGKYVEAVTYYQKLEQAGIDEIQGVRVHYRLAETLRAGAAYEDAIPYYEALMRDMKTPQVLFGAAFSYYQTDQTARSIQLLEQLIETDPDYYAAYMLAGQAAMKEERNEQAYTFFTNGIRRDAYDKELQLAAGKCALKLQMTEQAEQHLMESLALDPDYVEAVISLASLYSQQEASDKLIRLFKETDEALWELPILAAFYAFALEDEEQFDDAYVSYSKAYVGMKDDPEFLHRYARFLIDEGKRDEAVKVVQELLAIAPDHHDEWASFLALSIDEEV